MFETEQFKHYADERLILVLLDFPRLKKNRLSPEQIKHNEYLAEKYNKTGKSPLVIVLDAQENITAKTGHIEGGANQFIDFLNQQLQRSATSGR